VWLFLFLLLIPTQLGRHFWPDWSYVLGIRVDYLSPTLYLLDLVWIGILVKSLKSKVGQIKNFFNFKNLLILGFIAINILIAVNPWVAVYKWLRIGQLLISFWYFRENKKIIKEKLIKIIPCWIVFESLLAVAQIAKNGSLNGIFYWLGERSFTFSTIGIAQISVLGRGLIRAYGTFSHPNSLAGFLLVSLLLWYWIKPLCLDKSRHLPLKKGEVFLNIFWWAVFWLGLLGILVSGSRTVWVLKLGLILFLVLRNLKNKKNIIGFILLFLGVVAFVLRLVNMEYHVSDFLGGWDSDGIEKRIQLNISGLKMIKESPWFGVGLGNFLVRLPEFQKNNGIFWLQPVHNILILALSQVGILGLVILIYNFRFLIFENKKRDNFVFKIILGIVIITGMMDHYWLTLPQNWWLLTLVLGMI